MSVAFRLKSENELQQLLLKREAPRPPPAARSQRGPSKTKFAEDKFAVQCLSQQLPKFERGLKFSLGSTQFLKKGKPRRWAFDVAFPEYKIAVEIEGLIVRRIGGQLVTMGRHSTITGFREDCEKYAAAAILGWSVIRFEASQVITGFAIATTQRLLYAKGWRR